MWVLFQWFQAISAWPSWSFDRDQPPGLAPRSGSHPNRLHHRRTMPGPEPVLRFPCPPLADTALPELPRDVALPGQSGTEAFTCREPLGPAVRREPPEPTSSPTAVGLAWCCPSQPQRVGPGWNPRAGRPTVVTCRAVAVPDTPACHGAPARFPRAQYPVGRPARGAVPHEFAVVVLGCRGYTQNQPKVTAGAEP